MYKYVLWESVGVKHKKQDTEERTAGSRNHCRLCYSSVWSARKATSTKFVWVIVVDHWQNRFTTAPANCDETSSVDLYEKFHIHSPPKNEGGAYQ